MVLKIPAGTKVYVGDVGSQGGFYVGGTQQIVVPKSWEINGDQANKMTKIEDIKQTLSRMSELLRIGGDNDWGMALEKFDSEMSRTPDETVRRILSLYGGMGSLNDLVLYVVVPT